MKKILLLLLLAWVIFLSFVMFNQDDDDSVDKSAEPYESQESTEEVTDYEESEFSNENTWAIAYLDAVNDLIDKYGEGAIEPNVIDGAETMTGVAIVRLIDFDGDGTYELYLAYADQEGYWVNKQMVYGYNDGLVVLLEEREISNPGTDISPSTTFLSKNGKVYLVDIDEGNKGNYFTVQEGEMISVLSFQYDFEGENHILNGAVVAKEEIWTALDDMEADGTFERIEFVGEVDTANLTKTQDTIAEIEAQIE